MGNSRVGEGCYFRRMKAVKIKPALLHCHAWFSIINVLHKEMQFQKSLTWVWMQKKEMCRNLGKKLISLMYLLDSAYEKVQRLKTKLIFCHSIWQAQSNRTAGRPKYKSVERNWFKCRALHVLNLVIRFSTYKVWHLNQALKSMSKLC